jgi:flavin-dependent dehydrogenase
LRREIAIVGSGTAGLQLAYALRNDFEVTVIHAHSSEKIKNGRIMSTQVHFDSTKKREERYQMPIWKDVDSIQSVHISIGKQKLFVGRLKEPALSIDQRLYFSFCMDDLVKKEWNCDKKGSMKSIWIF